MNLFNPDILTIWNMVFLKPIFLYVWFFGLFLLAVLLYFSHKKQIQARSSKLIDDFHNAWFWLFNIFFSFKYILIIAVYITFITLFADPNYLNIKEKIQKDWIDIVIALDISKSMEAEDLQPNRITAAKQVIWDFVKEVWSDRLWLVVFAWKPYSSIPLTYDYRLITEVVAELSTDTLNQNISGLDWTAIWDALLLSSTILEWEEEDQAIDREKIIILLTDGDANRWVDPLLAAELLKSKKTKTYTIWVGSKEWGTIAIQNWPFRQTQQIAPLNETTLREIASLSNWKFFRATDNNSLEDIFLEISKLEKTELETEIEKNYTSAYELFLYLLLVLLWLLFSLQYKYKL